MMEKPLKTVLITGAARRIGRAIAVDLAAAGWEVAVHYNHSEADAAAVVDEISAQGGKAAAVKADLANEEAAAGLVERVVAEIGPLAALVNNASVFQEDTPKTATKESWEAHMQVNLRAPFQLTQAFAAGLIEQAAAEIGPLGCLVNNASVFQEDTPQTATKESWEAHMQVNLRAPFQLTQAFAAGLPSGAEGNVINLIDQRVWNVTPYFTSYTVSKVALWGLTQNLALALAPSIRVNAIGPGPTLPSVHQTDEQFQRQWSALPLSRPVMPEEICRAVRFLLDAPSITGQMIVLDGGQHLGWKPGAKAEKAPE